MKKISVLFTAISFLFFNCENEKKTITPNQVEKSDSISLVELAIDKGDIKSYDKLRMEYMDSPYEEFLEISTKMANKHDYKSAYIDVFYCLTNYYQTKDEDLLENINDSIKTKAIKYLKLAAEKGEVNALEILSNLYLDGKHLKEDKELSKELLLKRDSILSTFDID